MASIVRPTWGRTYYAPVMLDPGTFPIVFGERRGIIVDEPSQECAVVYTTREAAEAALADPAQWAPGNAARARIAAVVYRPDLIGARFAYASDAERDAIREACK